VWKGTGVGGCICICVCVCGGRGGRRFCIYALLCWMHGKLVDHGMCGLVVLLLFSLL